MHHSRSGRKGGGTGLLFRENIGVKEIDAGEKTSFEFSEWSLSLNSFRARLSIIYRPPYSAQHPVTLNTFMDEFATYLESIILVPEPLIVNGELNIHVNDANDPDACEFLDLLVSMGLKQHVKGSTHEGGHTLDKLGYEQRKFMNCKNFGFHGNQWTSNLALYLKMLVLVTAINVINFMLVSKSAQFA